MTLAWCLSNIFQYNFVPSFLLTVFSALKSNLFSLKVSIYFTSQSKAQWLLQGNFDPKHFPHVLFMEKILIAPRAVQLAQVPWSLLIFGCFSLPHNLYYMFLRLKRMVHYVPYIIPVPLLENDLKGSNEPYEFYYQKIILLSWK